MHSGLVKLQNGPLGVNSHVCVLLPTSSKPVLQVYVTTLPSSVSVKLLFPSTGIPGSPQSTKTKQIYASVVHITISSTYIFQDRDLMQENKLRYQKMLDSGLHDTELLQYQCWHPHSRQTARNDTHLNSSLCQNLL